MRPGTPTRAVRPVMCLWALVMLLPVLAVNPVAGPQTAGAVGDPIPAELWSPSAPGAAPEKGGIDAASIGAGVIDAAVIGDSLLAGGEVRMTRMLARAGIQARVDVRGGRALRWGWLCSEKGRLVVRNGPGLRCRPEGYELLRGWRESGELPAVVAVALGTNNIGLPAPGRVVFEELAGLVAGRRVILVTVGRRERSTRVETWNAELRAWCAVKPLCGVVDWAASREAGLAGSYYPDGVHLRAGAQRSREHMIVDALLRSARLADVRDRVERRTGTRLG